MTGTSPKGDTVSFIPVSASVAYLYVERSSMGVPPPVVLVVSSHVALDPDFGSRLVSVPLGTDGATENFKRSSKT